MVLLVDFEGLLLFVEAFRMQKSTISEFLLLVVLLIFLHP